MTGRGGGVQKRDKIVREKLIFVREKSVKSQGISFHTKSGHPDLNGDQLAVL